MTDTNREAGKPGISRGAQTAWIVGAIAAVGLVYAYYETRLPATNPYSQCQFLFWEDSSCAGEVAADRIMGGDGWGPARERLDKEIAEDLARDEGRQPETSGRRYTPNQLSMMREHSALSDVRDEIMERIYQNRSMDLPPEADFELIEEMEPINKELSELSARIHADIADNSKP